ncbi:putative G-protein coupled receptor 33, partial [Clarias magur]
MTLSVTVSQHHRSPRWFCSSVPRRTRDSTPASTPHPPPHAARKRSVSGRGTKHLPQ